MTARGGIVRAKAANEVFGFQTAGLMDDRACGPARAAPTRCVEQRESDHEAIRETCRCASDPGLFAGLCPACVVAVLGAANRRRGRLQNRISIKEFIFGMGQRILSRRSRASPECLRELERHVEFVVGNTLFVLGHETGHALVSEMGIPILGHEENAADVFATLMALKVGDAFSDRTLINVAKGWFLSDRRGIGSPRYQDRLL